MLPMDGNTVSVERVINAKADEIFALLADAGKHATFDGSDSVNHASQPSVPLSSGREIRDGDAGAQGDPSSPIAPPTPSSSTSRTAASHGRPRFSAVGSAAGSGATNSGRAEGTDGTLVRETWDVSQDKQKWMITSGSMPHKPRTACAPPWIGSPGFLEISSGQPLAVCPRGRGSSIGTSCWYSRYCSPRGVHQVALFQLSGNQDVAGRGDREQQVSGRHGGRPPEGQ